MDSELVNALTNACLKLDYCWLFYVAEPLKLPNASTFHVYVCCVVTPADLTVRVIAEGYSVSTCIRSFHM